MPTVTLMDSDIAMAGHIALWRRKRGRKLPPGHGAPTKEEDAMELDERGARCEMAGYLYLRPVFWDPWKIGSTEFEGFIDVKGVRRFTDHLIISDPKRDVAFLLVIGANHPDYQIGGWCWGKEIADRPYREERPDGWAIWIKPDDPVLKPPELLLAVLRERQRAKYGDLDKVWIGVEPEPK